MADVNESKTRNLAFLRQMDRQRLNKPSNRAIDLRGKVVGECQAYSFGGMTHYLDDRGYLLVKQLIARFNGEYTIGVYETLFKAMKTLPQESETSTIRAKQTILSRDDSHVQLIALDQQFERKESRITHATPVEVRIDDMLYNGTTLDIAAAAIRINLKRVFTLEKGDKVTVTFPELGSLSEQSLLSNIPYNIIKIEHDDRRSHIILALDKTATSKQIQWWQKWTDHQQSLENFDVDHQLLNIASHFYLRLYNQTIKKPLLWLGDIEQDDPIKVIHLGKLAESVVEPLLNNTGKIDLSLLPIKQVLESTSPDYLALLYSEKDKAKSAIVACDDSEGITQILNFHNNNDSHLLLLQSHPQTINPEHFTQELEQLAKINTAYAETLTEHLSTICQLITISDISASCQRLVPTKVKTAAQTLLSLKNELPVISNLPPKPSVLDHHIDRKSQRFLIKTDVLLYLFNQRFDVISNDVSEKGMSLSLPGYVSAPEGTVIRVNFVRWQTQTKKVKLDAVPFIVKRMQYWEGFTTLGLERNIIACGEKVNTFFSTTIEHNKNQLAIDTRDALISQKSKIFSDQLTGSLTSIPFFLAMNRSNKRILQAVATTKSNQAQNDKMLWQALQVRANTMSELLKAEIDEGRNTTDFGLYCYVDSIGNWLINSDEDFNNATQKSLFINRALLSSHYRFFHCSLSSIKPDISGQEADLNQQLSALRQHSPNNVRQIKDIIHSLYALGDLTDVSHVIAHAFKQNNDSQTAS